MADLGYPRFGVQASDWGAAVSIVLAVQSPDRVTGLHLSFIPRSYRPPVGDGQAPLTPEERAFRDRAAGWFNDEGGYHNLQSTKPQTPAYGLTDSPAGLAAWIVEKMRGWSDSGGDAGRAYTLDEILTNLSIFWFTGAIGPSMWFYREARAEPVAFAAGERVAPPLGVAVFPRETMPPRSWVERVFDVARWTEMPRGGHFGAMEAPELIAREIRAFFRPLRQRSA